MARVSIDDQTTKIETESQCLLRDVLSSLTPTIPPDRVVSEVILNGDRLRNCWNPASMDRPVSGDAEIHIRTTDRQIWEAAGVDMALSTVERVQRTLIRAAEMFRDGSKVDANRFFVSCIDGMERFLETLMLTRLARKLDFAAINVHGLPLSQIEAELKEILSSIVESQEKQDYFDLADKLEYELLTNLSTWASALRQLRV